MSQPQPQRSRSSQPNVTGSVPRESPSSKGWSNPNPSGFGVVRTLAIICALVYGLFLLGDWSISALKDHKKTRREVADLSESVSALFDQSVSLLNESPASKDAIHNLIVAGKKHRSRFQFNSALRDFKQAREMLMAIALRANTDSRAQRASLLASKPWLELLDISRSEQAAEELQKSTKALAAGLPIEAAAAARTALDLLNGASIAYDQARKDALEESLSGQTLLWLPSDVARKAAFSATQERVLIEYRRKESGFPSFDASFRHSSENDLFSTGTFPTSRVSESLALKLLISRCDSLVDMPPEDVFRLLCEHVRPRDSRSMRPYKATSNLHPEITRSVGNQLMRMIVSEADDLAAPHESRDHFPATFSPDKFRVRQALFNIARQRRATIDSEVAESLVASARAALNGSSPTTWPSSLAGVWQQNGTSYFAQSAPHPRLFQIPEHAGSPVEAVEDGTQPLIDHCHQIIGAHSTIAASLFTILPSGSNIVVQTLDGTLAFSQFEWELLRKGHPLPDRSDVERWIRRGVSGSLVMYSHPLMNRAGPYRDLADDFCFALQNSYPDARVYRDPFSEKTTRTAAALNKLPSRSAQHYVAIIAEESFGVTDGKVIQNIRNDLTDGGMKVVKVANNTSLAWEGERGKGVIVITGHSSTELAHFVHQIGEAGMLRDNFIVFNSCQTPVTRELASQMVEMYGAHAAFVHEGVIKAAAVQNLMVDLVGGLEASNKVLPDLLRELLRKNGLNGVWTICLSVEQKNISITLSA